MPVNFSIIFKYEYHGKTNETHAYAKAEAEAKKVG